MNHSLLAAALLPCALLLDALLGDPRIRLHPVRVIGDLAGAAEKATRRLLPVEGAGWVRVLAGVVTWCTVMGVVGGVAAALLAISSAFGEIPRFLVSVFLVYVSIAARDLTVHAQTVARALGSASIDEARHAVSMMVSRDTDSLDEEGLIRATVESVSENASDGVIAPLLFAAVFGPLGAILYRAANTMDAMFGYKNDRYRDFGRFAARADDVLNFVPARFCAFAMCLVGMFRRSPLQTLPIVRRDGGKHDSPNAGYPESATAAVLGIQLGGPNIYFGGVKEKPWIGEKTRRPIVGDIFASLRLMWGSTLLTVALGGAIRGFLLLL